MEIYCQNYPRENKHFDISSNAFSAPKYTDRSFAPMFAKGVFFDKQNWNFMKRKVSSLDGVTKKNYDKIMSFLGGLEAGIVSFSTYQYDSS